MRITDIPLLSDVKEKYISLRKSGMCRDKATIELKNYYVAEISYGAEDDGAIFWIGLADGQWENREITTETAQQAMNALNLVEHSDWQITTSDISRRRTRYSHAPMPEKKIGMPRAKFRCEWKVGDTFAYKLLGAAAEDNNVCGQYILLRKVSDIEFGDGRLLPIVTLSLWGRTPFPKNSIEYNSVPILKLNNGRFALPNNLYEYRAELVIKNRKQLNALPLICIGNFVDVSTPDDEVIIDGAGCMTMIHPEYIDRDLNIRIKVSNMYEKSYLSTLQQKKQC